MSCSSSTCPPPHNLVVCWHAEVPRECVKTLEQAKGSQAGKWKQQWGKALWAGITFGPEWGAVTLPCECKGRVQSALWSLEQSQGLRVLWFSAREGFL